MTNYLERISVKNIVKEKISQYLLKKNKKKKKGWHKKKNRRKEHQCNFGYYSSVAVPLNDIMSRRGTRKLEEYPQWRLLLPVSLYQWDPGVEILINREGIT